MTDVSQTEALCAGTLPGESLDHLAANALRLVATRQRQPDPAVTSHYTTELKNAVASGTASEGLAVVRRMVDAGIRPAEIAEYYIPAVARQLGEMWCEDEMGFATVTIGSARLQGLLRDLEEISGTPQMIEPHGASILVVVASGIHHTMGAMVLTGQLRRRGHAVRLLLGAEPDAVSMAMRQARFDVVLISSPIGAPIEGLRKLVSAIKSATGSPPPVVIGGTIIETPAISGAGLLALTGADHATSDPDKALRLCGMTMGNRDSAGRTHGI